jgi:hypothetical protein
MCLATITFGVVIVSVHAGESLDQFNAGAIAEKMVSARTG